jgi:hypothetical protein
MEEEMRLFAIIVASSALTLVSASAFSASQATDFSSQGVGIEVGPGGVRVDEHRRWESRRERGDRASCRELRAACLNKERLGEQGEGNCRRYRRLCR